jgi:hypothetical protein
MVQFPMNDTLVCGSDLLLTAEGEELLLCDSSPQTEYSYILGRPRSLLYPDHVREIVSVRALPNN